jgi:hypothetical protein
MRSVWKAGVGSRQFTQLQGAKRTLLAAIAARKRAAYHPMIDQFK